MKLASNFPFPDIITVAMLITNHFDHGNARLLQARTRITL
jgi:hypothetical protein